MKPGSSRPRSCSIWRARLATKLASRNGGAAAFARACSSEKTPSARVYSRRRGLTTMRRSRYSPRTQSLRWRTNSCVIETSSFWRSCVVVAFEMFAKLLSSARVSLSIFSTCSFIGTSSCWMRSTRMYVSLCVSGPMPKSFGSSVEKNACPRKKSRSATRASAWPMFAETCACERFLTITYPSLSGLRTLRSVCITSSSLPGPMRSGLVSTPTVRSPPGSTRRARSRMSTVAMSWFDGITARMTVRVCER